MVNRPAAIKAFLLRAEENLSTLRQTPELLEIDSKEHAGDLVTAADLLVTELAEQFLQEHFPGELLLSEERPGAQQLLAEQPEFTGWVLDPIDGTNNFARQIPYWGVSLAWINSGEPDAGGILNAEGQLLVSGSESERRVSSARQLGPGTRVATSNNLDYQQTLASLQRYQQLPEVWVDCLGSAANIFTDLAQGRLDLYHHRGLKPWDNPAGFLLVEQAGGVVYDFNGRRADWRRAEAIAGPQPLVEQFLELIAE